ncbi:MAG: C39 family peptidase [Defluviitaleaceae bacterium]|nr:C39 family peptidase [Defluviitaleaceae bacterium]
MKKKISLLIISLVLSSSVSVYAQDATGRYEQNDGGLERVVDTWYDENGFLLTPRPEVIHHEPDHSDIRLTPMAIYDEVLTDEEREEREARLQEVFEFWSDPDNVADVLRERIEIYGEPTLDVRRSLRWTDLRPFTYFAQQLPNTCGPASVRMVMHHWRGWSPDEITIMTGINGFPLVPGRPTNTEWRYANPIRDFIRSNMGFGYVVSFPYATSMRDMSRNLTGIVTHYHRPSLVGVNATTANGWMFNIPSNQGDPIH